MGSGRSSVYRFRQPSKKGSGVDRSPSKIRPSGLQGRCKERAYFLVFDFEELDLELPLVFEVLFFGAVGISSLLS